MHYLDKQTFNKEIKNWQITGSGSQYAVDGVTNIAKGVSVKVWQEKRSDFVQDCWVRFLNNFLPKFRPDGDAFSYLTQCFLHDAWGSVRGINKIDYVSNEAFDSMGCFVLGSCLGSCGPSIIECDGRIRINDNGQLFSINAYRGPIKSTTIYTRLQRGWGKERAFKQPVRKRNKIILTYQNQTMPLVAWSDKLGVSYNVLKSRYYRGLPMCRVLTGF